MDSGPRKDSEMAGRKKRWDRRKPCRRPRKSKRADRRKSCSPKVRRRSSRRGVGVGRTVTSKSGRTYRKTKSGNWSQVGRKRKRRGR